MTATASEGLAFRASRIEQGKLAAVSGLEISFGSVRLGDDLEVNTMTVGPFTVFENKLGVWSGWSAKIGREKRAVYGKPDGDVSDFIFWQMACSEIVNQILSGLSAQTTRRVFPQLSDLRGYELAHALRERVQAESRPPARLLRLLRR